MNANKIKNTSVSRRSEEKGVSEGIVWEEGSSGIRGGELDKYASYPGVLVYLESKQLQHPWYGLQPMLFTCIDLFSLLQTARLYLTHTIASAIDFFDFAMSSFPFRVQKVCTPPDRWLLHGPFAGATNRFSEAATARGVVHSMTSEPLTSVIVNEVRPYLFDGLLESLLQDSGETDINAHLRSFLLVHNNYKSLPTIGGVAPVQRLRECPEFHDVLSFDPLTNLPGRLT